MISGLKALFFYTCRFFDAVRAIVRFGIAIWCSQMVDVSFGLESHGFLRTRCCHYKKGQCKFSNNNNKRYTRNRLSPVLAFEFIKGW